MSVGYRIGIDTGGTYTDAVLCDETGVVLQKAKALTTKADLSIGIEGALAAILDGLHAPGRDALESKTPKTETAVQPDTIKLVSISTTLATNAVVERHGQPVGLILIGESERALDRAGLREALGADPAFLIPGGHTASGEEASPLDQVALEEAISEAAKKVSAFAVSSLFGTRNPAHEQAARDLILEKTGLPVTCGHDLSSNLDMPRRALTAVLNARLIPLIAELVDAVSGAMTARGINAPLMIVKGDGSLVSTETARLKPVETILSGPAASVVGARALSGVDDLIVSDIGGTTTDIAILTNGRPQLDADGATVGGWRTMVEAVAAHTVGLGGDSAVSLGETGDLVLGPRRALPLSLLATTSPDALKVLKEQVERPYRKSRDGQFAYRLRNLNAAHSKLSDREAVIWDRLADGPLDLETLLAGRTPDQPLNRLIDRGLVALSCFTPSDAAHVLGLHKTWDTEAAFLGAQIWALQEKRQGGPLFASPDSFAQAVVDKLVALSGEAIAVALLDAEEPLGNATPGTIGRRMLDSAFAVQPNGVRPLLSFSACFALPIAAIGAPAPAYYPLLEKRTGNTVLLSEHADVSNAVGAVAGGIAQTARAVITCPYDGVFRLHGFSKPEDFTSLNAAAEAATAAVQEEALQRAEQAGAGDIKITVTRNDRMAASPGGTETFIESEVTAQAVGRPAL